MRTCEPSGLAIITSATAELLIPANMYRSFQNGQNAMLVDCQCSWGRDHHGSAPSGMRSNGRSCFVASLLFLN